MNTIEQLLKLDINELTPKKTTLEIEIPRISNKLKKKGINEKFMLTAETVSPDTIYEYESAIYDVDKKGLKINKQEIYKQGLDICCASIVDPKYNDEQLINFLGITMKHPTADVVWKKLLLKQEIVSVSQFIIEASRKNIDEDEYNESLDKKRENIKN